MKIKINLLVISYKKSFLEKKIIVNICYIGIEGLIYGI